MRHQQIKETLKKFKPCFPASVQRVGVQAWRSIEVPLGAVLELRSIVNAQRIVFPVAEVADFDRFRMLGPGPDEVLVQVHSTVVSPGTERAQLLGLPGAAIYRGAVFPGYSGSGKVIAVGKRVRAFQAGDVVAGRIRHGSLAVVRPEWLFHVPPEVPLEKAAFIELGIIVLQGIRKSRIKPGESVFVLGQGLIGQMTTRLSRLAGGAPIVAAARSHAKAAEAVGEGAADRFLTLEELSRESVGEGFDVVIEATGNREALALACNLTCAGGRTVLLGTTWGLTSLALGQNGCRPGITLVGAHITGVPERDQSYGLRTYRNEGELFLGLIAKDRLNLSGLITHHIAPSRAGEVYQGLRSGGSNIIGVVFDWTRYTQRRSTEIHKKSSAMKQNGVLPLMLSRKWLGWKVDFDKEAATHTLSPEKHLRIGVVGGGDIGLHNATSVMAAPAAVVAAVCDVSPEVLADMGRRFHAPAVSDYESLLARSDVDAVLLSVPHMLHAPFAVQAARAGKHVLVEKPLGLNLGDATQIVDACRQAGVRLTVNFSFRLRPAIQLARALIRDGALGEISGVHINFLIYRGARFWAAGYTARASSDWRGSKEKAGGGILIMGICHAIDYVRYCTGLEVQRVSSEYGTFASPIEVEDAITVNCRYDNGAIGSVSASTAWRGTPLDEVRIWGTQGSLRIEENNKLSFWSARRWRGLAAGKEHHLQLPQIDYTINTAKWIHRFVVAIANGESHDITGKDGWINNAIIEAAYRSRDRGHAEDVKAFPWKDEI